MPITSAYNFVPLAAEVHCPEWQANVSSDLPLREGLCAELVIELMNHTPLLVGAERSSDNVRGGVHGVPFFCHPDGVPAIPGSSLRGMLRNVLEIATFSRMRLLDDRALSVRDLTNVRNEYMQSLVGGKVFDQETGAIPKARGAWLWFDGADWRLESAAVARTEHELLRTFFGLDPADWPEDGTPARRRWRVKARQKYAVLRAAIAAGRNKATIDIHDHLVVRFTLLKRDGRVVNVHPHSGGKYLNYKKVQALLPTGAPPGGTVEGVLVMTGQPGPSKHMEFVFAPCQFKPTARIVNSEVMNRFGQVHSQEDGDWAKYWEPRAMRGQPVPVFYLDDDAGELRCIGLSQMMRLPGEQSLGQLAAARQKPNARPLDFVETLFGRVKTHDEDPLPALRGRIAFGDLRLQLADGEEPRLAPPAQRNPTVLAEPKPGFYPNYLCQPHTKADGKLDAAATYHTVLSAAAALRGWKRYPVRPSDEVHVPDPPPGSQPPSQVWLEPLAEGQTFRGVVRLHNVTREELGAVIWALTWGGDAQLRHSLGMGKPFGFGQVEIGVVECSIRPNDPGSAASNIDGCRATFEQHMERHLPRWRHTASMRELLAMADPTKPQANRATLKPLTLTVGAGGTNEFTIAKHARDVLRDYSEID